MIGFTSAFANTIKEIFDKHIPNEYQTLFYEIIDSCMTKDNTLYYTWYKDDGSYEDLVKILKENGFEVEEDYEDCASIGLIISW